MLRKRINYLREDFSLSHTSRPKGREYYPNWSLWSTKFAHCYFTSQTNIRFSQKQKYTSLFLFFVLQNVNGISETDFF